MNLFTEKWKFMSREARINGFLVIFFTVGVAGLGLEATRELFIGLMPVSLLLGMGLMFWAQDRWKWKYVLVFLLVALLGFFVEVVGVLTGEVFGEYSYGRALGTQIWDTPPMIGLNWLMLVYCVYIIFRKTRLHVLLQVLLGAGLMVVYDLIMEPVAIRLDMWSWGSYDIPLQNYIAWFLISLVLLAIFHIAQSRFRNRVAPTLFFVQLGFFIALNLILV
ncbi:MAG: carotenoid biosynthesis protein [Bacteroidales bacterium]